MYKLLRIISTYKDYFIFAALIIISFTIIYSNTSDKIGGFRTAVAVSFGSLRNLFSWIPDIYKLHDVNKELMNMNTQYFAEVNTMKKAIEENTELRIMLDMKKSYKYPLIVCDVHDKNSIQLRNYIVLNKGKKNNIKNGMPVISLKGLIGNIIRCSDNFAVVETINNKNVKIPAVINKSKLNGIVYWNNDDFLYMQYILNTEKVDKGDEVYTSNLNSKYPEDILIGYVHEVINEQGTFFHKIIIKPANRFFDYRQVFVINYIKDKEELELIEEVENRMIELNKKKK